VRLKVAPNEKIELIWRFVNMITKWEGGDVKLIKGNEGFESL
jgi:hypothetical protein